jgi:hypothetical protein
MFCGHIPSVAAEQVFIIVYVKCDVQFVKAGFKEHHICLLFCFTYSKVIRNVGEEV